MAGRPKTEWSDEQYRMFEALCAAFNTQEDICSVMGTTDKTLNKILKRRYKMNFSECFKKFSAKGRISLRKKQFEVAHSGNVSMLIWMGKQHLNQTDRQDLTSGDEPMTLRVVYGNDDGTGKRIAD